MLVHYDCSPFLIIYPLFCFPIVWLESNYGIWRDIKGPESFYLAHVPWTFLFHLLFYVISRSAECNFTLLSSPYLSLSLLRSHVHLPLFLHTFNFRYVQAYAHLFSFHWIHHGYHLRALTLLHDNIHYGTTCSRCQVQDTWDCATLGHPATWMLSCKHSWQCLK